MYTGARKNDDAIYLPFYPSIYLYLFFCQPSVQSYIHIYIHTSGNALANCLLLFNNVSVFCLLKLSRQMLFTIQMFVLLLLVLLLFPPQPLGCRFPSLVLPSLLWREAGTIVHPMRLPSIDLLSKHLEERNTNSPPLSQTPAGLML